MSKRPPWGHVSRHCVYCNKVGPRVVVLGGYAHRRCIPREQTAAERRERRRERKEILAEKLGGEK